MKKHIRLLERVAAMAVGAALMTVGFLFLVLGITFLPVIGILVAFPVMLLSLHFLSPRLEVAPATGEKTQPTEGGQDYPVNPVLRPQEAV